MIIPQKTIRTILTSEALIMKEIYITPDMEVIGFECDDIITTSEIVPDEDETVGTWEF